MSTKYLTFFVCLFCLEIQSHRNRLQLDKTLTSEECPPIKAGRSKVILPFGTHVKVDDRRFGMPTCFALRLVAL